MMFNPLYFNKGTLMQLRVNKTAEKSKLKPGKSAKKL